MCFKLLQLDWRNMTTYTSRVANLDPFHSLFLSSKICSQGPRGVEGHLETSWQQETYGTVYSIKERTNMTSWYMETWGPCKGTNLYNAACSLTSRLIFLPQKTGVQYPCPINSISKQRFPESFQNPGNIPTSGFLTHCCDT